MCILAFLYQFVVNVKHFLCHIVSFKPLDVLLAFGYSLFSSGCTHKYLFDSFRHAEGVIGFYIYRFVSACFLQTASCASHYGKSALYRFNDRESESLIS